MSAESAEQALAALARDLVEEIAAGRALELAGSGESRAGVVPYLSAEGIASGTTGMAGSPVVTPALPSPRTGAGAVFPHLGHHLVTQYAGDSISGHAHYHVPKPFQPYVPDAKDVKLAEQAQELAGYKDWEEKVGDYRSATRELEQHVTQQARQGIPLDGTYKPWTPDEHASHARYAEDTLAGSVTGKSTAQTHTLDSQGQVWHPDRAALHKDIVQQALEKAVNVPSGRSGILVGGVAGSPKRSATRLALPNPQDYVHVDHDRIKEDMALRGMVPEVRGLSPMEASPLVHAEAVHIGHLIAHAALRSGKNLAVHLPMSDPDAVREHAQRLRDSGYTVHGVYIHTPVDKAVKSWRSGHRSGHEKYRREEGPGSRYISPGLLGSTETSPGSSVNSETFEKSKPHLDSWEHWDASEAPRRSAQSEQPRASHGIPSVEELRRSRGA